MTRRSGEMWLKRCSSCFHLEIDSNLYISRETLQSSNLHVFVFWLSTREIWWRQIQKHIMRPKTFDMKWQWTRDHCQSRCFIQSLVSHPHKIFVWSRKIPNCPRWRCVLFSAKQHIVSGKVCGCKWWKMYQLSHSIRFTFLLLLEVVSAWPNCNA